MSTREEFEKWAEGREFDLALFSDSDCYRNDDTTLSWSAWQAATRVERAACLNAADKAYATDHVLEAIRARGDQS